MRSPVTIREQLEEHRRAGLDFAAAWPAALEQLTPEDRAEWLGVLQATARAWEAAYVQAPATRPQLALAAVGSDPERELPTGQPDAWERACEQCGDALPAGKRPTARFCGRACQRASHGRRIAA